MAPTKNLERMLFAISNMRRNGQFCDVEIVAHCGEIFQAHSCILATASSCLQNMIQKGCYDPQKRVTKVFLPESISASSFSSLLDLIYSCNVNVKLSKQLRQTHLVRLDELFSSEDDNLENSAKELDILLSEHARKRFKTKKSMSHTEQAGEVMEEKTLTVALSSPRRSKRIRTRKKPGPHLDGDFASAPDNQLALVDDEEYSVEDLGFDSDSNELLNDSAEPGESNLESFPCDFCRVVLKSRKALERHKLRFHTAATLVQCDICQRNFVNEVKLAEHKLKHVLNKKRSKCTVCNKTFTSPYVMKLHVRTHTGDELYGCTSCGKKFPYKSSLQTHMILHSGEKSFTCTVCGKSFAQKAHAKEHEASHVGIKRFSCMECQKRFAHKSGLARHISSIHLQYRPFACDICGRTFPLKTKLLEHTRIHTGEKPYVCSLCGLAYKANRSLKKHKKNLHGIEVRAYEVGISKRLRNELRPITTVSSTPILNSNPQQPTIVTVLSPAPPNHNFNTLKMTDVNQNRALQMFLPDQQPMQENLTHTTQEQSSSGNDVPKSLHVMKTLTHCEMIGSQTSFG